jgi:uncharacterized protein YihD (DUF1040 family)
MMREIERIDRILSLMGELWKKHPDYRFYQFLINEGFIEDSQLWHIEDTEVEAHLKKVMKRD